MSDLHASCPDLSAVGGTAEEGSLSTETDALLDLASMQVRRFLLYF
jgi:hypothetical protein